MHSSKVLQFLYIMLLYWTLINVPLIVRLRIFNNIITECKSTINKLNINDKVYFTASTHSNGSNILLLIFYNTKLITKLMHLF